jgi:hypothetical protein
MPERTRVPTKARAPAYARSALPKPHHRSSREPPAVLPEIRSLAADLGLDSDELIPAGSPIERERLAAIEQGASTHRRERRCRAEQEIEGTTYRAVAGPPQGSGLRPRAKRRALATVGQDAGRGG